jgi:hypothetical protein
MNLLIQSFIAHRNTSTGPSRPCQFVYQKKNRGDLSPRLPWQGELLRNVVGVAIRVAQGAATRCQAMNAKRDVAKEIGIGHARCLQRGKPVPVNAKITRNSPNFQEEFVTPV